MRGNEPRRIGGINNTITTTTVDSICDRGGEFGERDLRECGDGDLSPLLSTAEPVVVDRGAP